MKGRNWKSSRPHTPWLPAGSILYVFCSLRITRRYLCPSFHNTWCKWLCWCHQPYIFIYSQNIRRYTNLSKTLKIMASWSSMRRAPTLQRQQRKAANAASWPVHKTMLFLLLKNAVSISCLGISISSIWIVLILNSICLRFNSTLWWYSKKQQQQQQHQHTKSQTLLMTDLIMDVWHRLPSGIRRD